MYQFLPFSLLILLAAASSSVVLAQDVTEVNQSTNETQILEDQKQSDEVSTTQSSTSSQEAENTTQATLPPGLNQLPNKKLMTNLSLMTSTDLKSFSDDSKSYGSTFGFGIGYRVKPKYILRLRSSIAKDLSNGFDERLNNTNLSLSHLPIRLTSKTLLIPVASIIYPTSKDSKVRDDMHGAVSTTAVLIQNLNSALSLRYVPTVVAYSHKYTTNRIGSTNNQYTAQQAIGLDYMITDSLSIGTSYTFVQNWSYSGRQKDFQYATDISSSYFFKDLSNLTAGINTGGLLYQTQRGPDSNVEFYDPNSTSFYLVYGIAL